MTLSTAMAIASRVAVTGLLTVSCFKRAVVDNTAQVLAKVEKASVGFVVYSVCLSTITLVLAADKAAQRILSNEPKHMPAPLKDDDADSNPPSANDPTTSESVTHQPVESSHLQPFSSPSPSRLIKSTEIIFAPISTCTPDNNIISATPKPVELYHLQPSPTSSPSRLIKSTEIISAPISTCTPNHNTISAAPKPVESYHLQPSPTSSPSRLIESTETASAPITCSNTCSSCITLTSPDLYCKRLFIDSSTTLVPHDDDPATGVFSDDASDANDCESFSDESTIHEDDCSEPKPQKEHHALEPTLDILIAKMTGLTLDDPPCPSRLRPLILVNSRHHSSTTIRYPRSLNPPTPWMH